MPDSFKKEEIQMDDVKTLEVSGDLFNKNRLKEGPIYRVVSSPAVNQILGKTSQKLEKFLEIPKTDSTGYVVKPDGSAQIIHLKGSSPTLLPLKDDDGVEVGDRVRIVKKKEKKKDKPSRFENRSSGLFTGWLS